MREDALFEGFCKTQMRRAMGQALAPFGDDLDTLIEDSGARLMAAFENRSQALTPLQGLWKMKRFNDMDERTQAEIWKTTLETRSNIHLFFQAHPEGSCELSEDVYSKVIRHAIDLYEMKYPERHIPNVGLPVTDKYAQIYQPAEQMFRENLRYWPKPRDPHPIVSEPAIAAEKGFGDSVDGLAVS